MDILDKIIIIFNQTEVKYMSKSNLPVLLLKNLVLLPLEEARIELNNDVTKKIIDISKNILMMKYL